MNLLEGFKEHLRNGETKKAIDLLSMTGMDRRYFRQAVLANNIEVMDFLVKAKGSECAYDIMYRDTNDFGTINWLLQRKIGLGCLNGPSLTNLTPLDCSKSLAIMYLLIEYGATGLKKSSKLAIMRYRNHKASLRTICAIIISARNGHKDTNAIIARLDCRLKCDFNVSPSQKFHTRKYFTFKMH